MRKSPNLPSSLLGLLTLSCILLATCSQARRISHRHDVGPPQETLDTGGWRPVVESGRPQLEQVAVAPTGYDGDADLVPPPRRNNAGAKKPRPGLKPSASEIRSSTAYTLPPPSGSSTVRFPGDQARRPTRKRQRPGPVHLRPYLAQESAQHLRFRPSPPAPDNFWPEPTEPSVSFFTPQHYNEGPLQLSISPHEQHQLISTQQVFGNPALFNLEQPIRRPQDNAFLEPSIHENEVVDNVPKYQITEPSPPPPRRRRPKPPPPTEETPLIEPEMHRSPEVHEAPAWATEQPAVVVRPRRPRPPVERPEEEEEPVRRRPARPPAPVQEQLEDDMEVPVFNLRPRRPIVSPPTEEQVQEEEKPRPRRPRPTPAPVAQEDPEEEVSPATPQEEERPLKRRRPRPPGEGGQRRRRPKPRPQPPVVVESEQEEQQQPEEGDRNVYRRPIKNWPTKETIHVEEPIVPEHHEPEEEANYPVIPQHHQQEEELHIPEEAPSAETVEEEVAPSAETYEEEPNYQEPNQVSSTEGLYSIPPKRKRPEESVFSTTESTTTSSTTSPPPTTTSSISNRLRLKLNATRPRFSLNNIKERLRQQALNEQKDEQSTSTEAPKQNRFRFSTTSTTEGPTTERSTFRPSGRFTRPPIFHSRFRSTTEASLAVATMTDYQAARRANPNLYNMNRERRPPLKTLRSTTELPVTTPVDEEVEDEVESTTETEEFTTVAPPRSTTPEDFARRVTDLTSSATAYKPLSFFSAVPANGIHSSQLRFTMATEDPILPIEAFFPAFASNPGKPHGE
ncbi:proteoglycan 4-like [Neocloeon triangulifer]|uniref:proteoglycan 4-like n=1 Tax=Neocloeon triangulifer TaxID=2078957 RepID=UPI00286F822B|nr:proteoglycan 4-like [Neocloeon triangulifer]